MNVAKTKAGVVTYVSTHLVHLHASANLATPQTGQIVKVSFSQFLDLPFIPLYLYTFVIVKMIISYKLTDRNKNIVILKKMYIYNKIMARILNFDYYVISRH